jgi:hypothetical protein
MAREEPMQRNVLNVKVWVLLKRLFSLDQGSYHQQDNIVVIVKEKE